MKFIKWYKYIVCGAWAVLAFTHGVMAGPDADDPDTMDRIVHSPMLPIAMTDPIDTGTLLFSDSPEYPEQDGILYADKVSGDCRMYFYHVNQGHSPRKIVVMAYNPTGSVVDVVLKGYQYTRPSTSYYTVGKELSTIYYEGYATISKIPVEPYGYALLGSRLNDVSILPDQLFSGIVDMELPVPMYISAVILPVQADPVAFVQKQIYLPSDAAKLRGTFRGKDRYLSTLIPYSPNDGTGYVKIADGIADRFLQGRDVMDNRISENTGNYGVNYTIRLRTKGVGNIYMYFNPQGGEYAGVAELIYTNQKNGDDRKIVELPSKTLSMGQNDPFAMQYIDSFKAGSDVIVHIMPPGAANLPVRIVLVPDKQLRDAADAADKLKKLTDKAKNQMAEESDEKQQINRKAAQEAKRNTADEQVQHVQKNQRRHYEPVIIGN